jgi:NitT/TauT family transport system permease protein
MYLTAPETFSPLWSVFGIFFQDTLTTCARSQLQRRPKTLMVWGFFICAERKRRMEWSLKSSEKPTGRRPAASGSPWLVPVVVLFALAAWQAIVMLKHYEPFILPSPGRVWQRFLLALADGSLLRNSAATILEVLLGLLAGVCLATMVGYLLAKSRLIERLLSPFLVASQAVPIVAIAPLLVIWYGPGMFSKILICALIVFFPVLVNTVVGVRAVPENLHDLMRSMRASPWQTLVHLEIPAALPVFLGGLRIGATLSVIGAVVGEFVGSDRGLGFLINVGRGQYDTALVFVAVFALVAMALCLYGLVIRLEKHFLAWQSREK